MFEIIKEVNNVKIKFKVSIISSKDIEDNSKFIFKFDQQEPLEFVIYKAYPHGNSCPSRDLLTINNIFKLSEDNILLHLTKEDIIYDYHIESFAQVDKMVFDHGQIQIDLTYFTKNCCSVVHYIQILNNQLDLTTIKSLYLIKDLDNV